MRTKSLIMLSLLVVAGAARAQTFSDAECKVLGDLAEKVMALRQEDAPLSTVLEEVVGSVTDDRVKPIVRAVILMAYDRPAYSVAENRAEAVAEFRNDIELECFTAELPSSP